MCSSAETSRPTSSDAILRQMVDDNLAKILGQIEHPKLRDAANYAVLGGGKRIRPIICLRCCVLVGGPVEAALAAGCSFELIHAFSLVHDDLPALDDDDLRRGRPTVHKQYGEAIGILCGDILQSLAFTTAATSPNAEHVLAELARSTTAMIEGQTWDTHGGFPEGMPKNERLDLVHRNKTGALIRGSARAGALAGGADGASLREVERWGTAIGLMFQAVDDLLDETQSAEHLGKASGKDREAGKLTYPSIHGLEGTRQAIEALEQEANDALKTFSELAEPLREMTQELANRTR